MNTKQLFKHLTKPPLFERGNASMWEDPYISKQLLKVHLDPNSDMASRQPEIIDKTIKWLTDNYIRKEDKILDIGCGPGLYTTRLAKLGYNNITGLDFSKNSIAYARREAKKQSLKIEYLCESYLKMDIEDEFDIITLIFCDFGALTNSERNILLQKVYKALRPGGKFIFDFFSESAKVPEQNNRTWDFAENSFWAKGKYVVLSQNLYYPEESVSLFQHIVLTEDGRIKDYRFFNHAYTTKTITPVLENNGFKNIECTENFKPKDHWCSDIGVLFTKAEK